MTANSIPVVYATDKSHFKPARASAGGSKPPKQPRKKKPRRFKSWKASTQRKKDKKKDAYFRKLWNPLLGLPNAVIAGYGRTSVKPENVGYSAEYQAATIAAYCLANGCHVGPMYGDYPGSGHNFERPGLQQMLDACRNGEVNVVVVVTPSRLTREPDDRKRLAEYKEKHGITFISVYPENSKENIQRQDEFRKRQGYPVGRIPVGKMKNPQTGRLEMDPYDWAVYEIIQKARSNKYEVTWTEVADDLNRGQLKTKSGKKFTKDNARMLCKRLHQKYPSLLAGQNTEPSP